MSWRTIFSVSNEESIAKGYDYSNTIFPPWLDERDLQVKFLCFLAYFIKRTSASIGAQGSDNVYLFMKLWHTKQSIEPTNWPTDRIGHWKDKLPIQDRTTCICSAILLFLQYYISNDNFLALLFKIPKLSFNTKFDKFCDKWNF